VDQVRCIVIEAVPADRRLREQSAYSRTIYWIDPTESVALKIEYYDRGGRLLKILSNSELRRIGPYRRWTVTRVHDVTRNHATVVTITDRKINSGLGDEYFTVSYLERGR
jgi:Outer membrane lipoprotein-sorting protein